MAEDPTAWLNMLPPALTAWSAAAALTYILLEIKIVTSARCWAIGFVLIGLGVLAGETSPEGTSAASLAALAAYGLGVLIIGVGLLRYLGHEIPFLPAIIGGSFFFGGLVVTGVAIEGGDYACFTEIVATTALCLALATYCLFAKPARRHGGGPKFVALALILMAARPLLDIWSGDDGARTALVIALLTVAPILLCLGLAVMVLKDQDRRVGESDRRRRWTEDRFALAMRGSNDGVWDWDLATDTVFVTPRLRDICEVRGEADPKSEDMAALIHPRDVVTYLSHVRDVLQGKTENLYCETRLRPSPETNETADMIASDGGGDRKIERWILVRGVPVRGVDGRVSRMAGTVTDVTDRKLSEHELIDARDEAELASRSKTEFLAHISHELRTPLNSIIGFSDMIKSQVFGPIQNPRYEDYVGTINMAGRHLLGLISDIIDVSKVESGQTRLEDTLCDLNDIAESALRLVTDRIDQAGLKLTTEIAPDLPWLRGDEIRVKQILLNLLTNAAKFTPSGGRVTLTIDTDDRGRPRIVVSDTGIGISRKDIPKALSRFGRLGSPMTSTTDGMGLGLTLVQMFVDLHGGDFTLESDEGAGTRVEILFPANRALARPADPQTTTPTASQASAEKTSSAA